MILKEVQALNPLEQALSQFDAAADHLHLAPELRAILRVPKRELMVHFPVRMDDGTVTMFTGYRVQHNINRGPAKGAFALMRMSPLMRFGRWPCG